MKIISFLCCFFLLFISESQFLKNANETPVGFKKMTYQAAKQTVNYYYVDGKQKRTISCQLTARGAIFTLLNGKKQLATLRANGKSAQYRQAGTEKWVSYKLGLKKMDVYTRSIWLNLPLIQKKNGLTLYFPTAGEEEAGFNNALLPLKGDPTQTGEGTVTATCNCGEKMVTVTCQTGCGVTCKEEERTLCKVTSDGTEYDCETDTYCIGLCACR